MNYVMQFRTKNWKKLHSSTIFLNPDVVPSITSAITKLGRSFENNRASNVTAILAFTHALIIRGWLQWSVWIISPYYILYPVLLTSRIFLPTRNVHASRELTHCATNRLQPQLNSNSCDIEEKKVYNNGLRCYRWENALSIVQQQYSNIYRPVLIYNYIKYKHGVITMRNWRKFIAKHNALSDHSFKCRNSDAN